MSSPVYPLAPLVWRYSPVAAAVGFLIASACAAGNLYGQPSGQVRVATIIVGFVALAVAVAVLRMALVVDDEGIAVRFLGRARWVPWSDVKQVGLADVRGNETVRIVRTDDTQVDVPPSLLQPVRPTSKLKASARLRGIVRQILARDPGRRGLDL